MSPEFSSVFKGETFEDSLVLESGKHHDIQRALIDAAVELPQNPLCVREIGISGAPVTRERSLEFISIAGAAEPETADLYFSYSPDLYRRFQQEHPHDFLLRLHGKKAGSQFEIVNDDNGLYWMRPLHDATHNEFWHASAGSFLLEQSGLKMFLTALPELRGAKEDLVRNPDTFALTTILETAEDLGRKARDITIKDTVVQEFDQPHHSTHITFSATQYNRERRKRAARTSYSLEIRDVVDTALPAKVTDTKLFLNDEATDKPKLMQVEMVTNYGFDEGNGTKELNKRAKSKTKSWPANIRLSIRPITEHGGDMNSRKYMLSKLLAQKMLYLENPDLLVSRLTHAVDVL